MASQQQPWSGEPCRRRCHKSNRTLYSLYCFAPSALGPCRPSHSNGEDNDGICDAHARIQADKAHDTGEAAQHFNVDVRSVRRWEAGSPLPEVVQTEIRQDSPMTERMLEGLFSII